uniref:L domain-like protein n=1 Tax=Pseudictyota dubia TaxID=2749911 RepID=A0A7R9WI91_9STRA
MAPTSAAVLSLVKKICDDLLSTCNDISTEGTPQSKALAWLASDSKLEEYEEWRRIQRYVLATVAFSLEGWGTGGVVDWMDGPEDECSWVWGPLEMDEIQCDSQGRVTHISFDEDLVGQNMPRDVALLSSSLDELHFCCVHFNGNIPTEVGMLSKLQHLSLSFNKLSGPVPTELGQLTNLKELRLYGNRLSGHVPTELGHLTQLDILKLESTDLTGAMPEEVCRLQKPDGALGVLVADCEEVQCNCCTHCCVDGVRPCTAV